MSQQLKNQLEQYNILGLKMLNQQPDEDADVQLEREVSMGDISGIFKQTKIRPNKNTAPLPKRTQSAPEKEAEKRIKAQKAYAEQVRMLQKALDDEKKIREPVKQQKVQDEKQKPERKLSADKIEEAQKNLPHSQNRFQGQFKNLTKILFHQAQAKLLEEKLKKDEEHIEKQKKKEKELQYLEEIKQRNRELVTKQIELGLNDPDILKKKQEEIKEQERINELRLQKLQKKELRNKRNEEGRTNLGLQKADKQKLKKLKEQKILNQQQQEEEQKYALQLNEQKRKAVSQKLALQNKKQINQDLENLGDNFQMQNVRNNFYKNKSENLEESQQYEEDNEAKEVIDRKAILREQKLKRRQQEYEKQRQEELKKIEKEQRLEQLQEQLRNQRQQIEKKRAQTFEKQAKKADIKNQQNQEQINQKSDAASQLVDLKNWIENQMKIEAQKSAQNLKSMGYASKSQSPDGNKNNKNKSSINSPFHSITSNDPQNLKKQIPGNSILQEEDLKRNKARTNRYGVQGDNGYGDAVAKQKQNDDIQQNKPKNQDILNFYNQEQSENSSLNSEENQYDYQPVKQEPAQKRVILNQQVQEKISPSKAPPGMLNIKEEATRQKAEIEKRRTEAAIIIQRHQRAHLARKKVKKVRNRMQKEIQEDHNNFVQQYKANDKFNLQKFINEKQKLRNMNGTQGLDYDESISEKIVNSGSFANDSQQYKQKSPKKNNQLMQRTPLFQNLYPVQSMEKDPNSLISIFIKQNLGNQSPEQLIPEKDIKQNQYQNQQKQSVSKQQRSPIKNQRNEQTQKKHSQQRGQKHIKHSGSIPEDETIEEEIMVQQSSGKGEDEKYSSDFENDHITESIPSSGIKKGSGSRQNLDSSIIEESIPESLPELPKIKNQLKSKKTNDSIQEEINTDSIEDEVPDAQLTDRISEESYLKQDQKLKQDIQQQPLSKVERIRENIKQQYQNEGYQVLPDSLKKQKSQQQQDEKQKLEAQTKYRNSSQIIRDFEESKGLGTTEHNKLLKGLTEELGRYEAAVSGTIFVEQFQHIVHKSLAQRDLVMLGQRLSQLEAENKHKQEIADIRAEQIKMMSQFILLSSGGQRVSSNVDEKLLKKQQEDMMRSIQNIIEKPVTIVQQRIVEEVVNGQIVHTDEQEYIKNQKANASLKYSSLDQSKQKSGKDKQITESIQEDDSILDEVDDDIAEDSIKESIIQSQSAASNKNEQNKLSNVRRMIGSEQSIIDQSKNIIKPNQKSGGNLFEKNSFQAFTEMKFKDMVINQNNDGTELIMEDVLDKIENQIKQKSEIERKNLQKQHDSRLISPRTFQKKSKELEKWVTNEQIEIGNKRNKVKDTYQEIGQFIKKLEKEKKITMDILNNGDGITSRSQGILRQHSQVSITSKDSDGIKFMKHQLREIQERRIGGQKPETKYLNKKKEFVKQLLIEKQKAIERGVKDKIGNLESEMIDEMMQTALNIDIEAEIEKRVQLAKKISEFADDSASKSASFSRSKQNKKNVKFQTSPEDQKMNQHSGRSKQSSHYDSSRKSDQKSKSQKSQIYEKSMGESNISEMIDFNQESQQFNNSSSASKVKISSRKEIEIKNKDQQIVKENDSSLDRDENNDQESYSNEFISESIHSTSLSQSDKKNEMKSANALQNKAANIEESGYTENFEEQSIVQSQQKRASMDRHGSQIEVVNEVDDDNIQDSSISASEKKSEIQQEQQKPQQEIIEQSEIDLQDIEVHQSTNSVDWQFILQDKIIIPPDSEDQETTPVTSSNKSSITEIDQEEDDTKIINLENQESYPSGSLSQSQGQINEQDINQITDQIVNQILNDFHNDDQVRLEVQDIDENQFQNIWPYTLDRRPEPVIPPRQPVASQPADQVNQPVIDRESEVKQRHDQLMQKYQDEQRQIQEQHRKNIEYLQFIVQIVDKDVLHQALQRPIEHDPLKILEQIQAFDTEDQIDSVNMTYSQSQSALPAYLFDEIEKRFEDVHNQFNNSGENGQRVGASSPQNIDRGDMSAFSQEARNIHHLAIFDAFNEALDQERPYKIKGLPNPWSQQTRVTFDKLSEKQIDQIIKKAIQRVTEWDLTGAGTKYAPPPPPPPPQGEQDMGVPQMGSQENEEERNKAERQERLGNLLTKEVHQREQDWLDYEIEDTQVRFDLADMILEELADEITQFLIIKNEQQDPNMFAASDEY